MQNPARELLKLIDSWSNTGTLVVRRGNAMNDENERDFWEAQKKAARLLIDVEQFLRDDGTYDEDAQALVEAWIFLFPPRQDWCDNEAVFPSLSIALRTAFRQIARRIDDTSVPITTLTPDTLKSLRETLLEIREQIGELTQLAPEERDRLLQLIGDALGLLDDETTPLEAIRSHTCEIVGASLPLIFLVPDDRRDGFFSKLLRLTGMVVVQTSVSTAATWLASNLPTLAQITS